METYIADGVELEYQVRGAGEPLLLIHGGMIADSTRLMVNAVGLLYDAAAWNPTLKSGNSSLSGTSVAGG